MSTTGSCIEFFYWLISNSTTDLPVFSVIVVSEENVEKTVLSTYGQTPIGWNRFFMTLPAGVNRIVIQGTRSQAGICGLAIDDVIFQPCNNFGGSLAQIILFPKYKYCYK